jgi:hypothetical protein
VSRESTFGTLPPPVQAHSRKPGTFSSITPLAMEIRGPQQGGLSTPLESEGQHEDEAVFVSSRPTVFILLISTFFLIESFMIKQPFFKLSF